MIWLTATKRERVRSSKRSYWSAMKPRAVVSTVNLHGQWEFKRSKTSEKYCLTVLFWQRVAFLCRWGVITVFFHLSGPFLDSLCTPGEDLTLDGVKTNESVLEKHLSCWWFWNTYNILSLAYYLSSSCVSIWAEPSPSQELFTLFKNPSGKQRHRGCRNKFKCADDWHASTCILR